MKIGYYQFLPAFLKVEENLERIEKTLKKDEKQIKKLDLLVFPEDFISGPLDVDSFSKYKEDGKAEYIFRKLISISKIFPKQTFVMGTIIYPKKDGYRNLAIVLKNGKKVVDYSKKALIYNEKTLYSSDKNESIFQIGDTRIGLAVCWDLILPEVFRKYTGKVDLVVVPSFWGIGGNPLQTKYNFSLEKKYYTSLGIARAYENSFALLFINSVGQYKSSFYNDRLMGGSYFVLPPFGMVHKTNDKKYDKLHIVNFDIDKLKEYQKYYSTDIDYYTYKETVT